MNKNISASLGVFAAGKFARPGLAALALLCSSLSFAATVTVTPSTAAPAVGDTFYVDVLGAGFPDTGGTTLQLIFNSNVSVLTPTTVNGIVTTPVSSQFTGGVTAADPFVNGGLVTVLGPLTGSLPTGNFGGNPAFRIYFTSSAAGAAGITLVDNGQTGGDYYWSDVDGLPIPVTYSQAIVNVVAGGGGSQTKTTTITGRMGITAQGCLLNLTFNVGDGENCMYSGGPSQVPGLAPIGEGVGPFGQAAYYDSTTTPGAFTVDGSFTPTPNDGKIQQVINGTITVDNNGTPGDASDDLLSFDITFTSPNGGNIIRWLSSSVVDQYTSMNQVLAPHPVNSATANAAGGHDYVIGSQGFPLLLSFTDATANESAVGANNGPCVGQLFGSMDCDASFIPANVDPLRWTPWVYNPPGPSASPGLGSLEGNIGARTVGTVTNLSCVGTNGSSGINDCFDSKVSFAPRVIGPNSAPGAGKMAEDVGWDQLLLKVSTDGAGNVTSVAGFDVQEYNVFGPSVVCGSDPGATIPCNSWISGYFTATNGTASATDDTATTALNTPVVIKVAANDTGFTDPVTVSVSTPAAHGAAVVTLATGSAANVSITYTPTTGYSGTDSFNYTVTDGTNTDTGTVSITVTGGGGNVTPVASAGSITTISTVGVNPVGRSGTFTAPGTGGNLGNAPAVVTVSVAPTKGTTSVSGNVITYTVTSATFFSGTDTFTYLITDADGETSSAVVTVTIANVSPTIADGSITTTADTASAAFTPVIALGNGSATQNVVAVTTQGTSGTCVVSPGNATGTVVYTPTAGFVGTDSCVLTVTDDNGTGASDTGTINVTVNSAGGGSITLGGGSAMDLWSLSLLAGLPLVRRRRRG